MAFPVEDTYIRPLFYEALTGEFKPPSDPEKRVHTLGKITIATFTKGTLIRGFSDEWHVGYEYNLSWAPKVHSRVICLEDMDHLKTNLSQLVLNTESEELTFQDALNNSESESSGIVIVSSGKRIVELPLWLGPELEIAKEAITNSAQSFFNRQRDLLHYQREPS